VKDRLAREQRLSFTEFSYMLLQAYDFLALYDRHGCTLQIGGSDQWGNIVSGIDLIHRMRGGEAHALTVPLITTASGEKMGKTADGAVWLDPARTPPYAFYQFWLNQADADVARFLHYFTFLGAAEVADVAAAHAVDPSKRSGQRRLAEEVTRFVHWAWSRASGPWTTGTRSTRATSRRPSPTRRAATSTPRSSAGPRPRSRRFSRVRGSSSRRPRRAPGSPRVASR
jgi:tyrosyl-tRNA synthetase